MLHGQTCITSHGIHIEMDLPYSLHLISRYRIVSNTAALSEHLIRRYKSLGPCKLYTRKQPLPVVFNIHRKIPEPKVRNTLLRTSLELVYIQLILHYIFSNLVTKVQICSYHNIS